MHNHVKHESTKGENRGRIKIARLTPREQDSSFYSSFDSQSLFSVEMRLVT